MRVPHGDNPYADIPNTIKNAMTTNCPGSSMEQNLKIPGQTVPIFVPGPGRPSALDHGIRWRRRTFFKKKM